MEEQKPGKKMDEKVTDETRYKYIGFDVYPRKPKRFWKSEDEKRKLVEGVKKKVSKTAMEERDHSLVRAAVFTRIDRLVLTVASLIMTVSLVLPWFSLRGENFGSQVIGLGFFLKLGALFSYAPLSGPLFSVFVILVGVTILSSFVTGLVSLLALLKKQSDTESYLSSLKGKLKLNLIPLVSWAALLVIACFGMSTPFAGILGVDGFGDSFTVINFFVLSSFGVWLALPSVIVNCVKINDL